jgi:PTS system cellobiose-specific IIC component
MNGSLQFVSTRLAPALTRLSENIYLSAIRAGMVSIAPLTIIGGLFLIVANLPAPGWAERVKRYSDLLQIPVTATFGMLALFACFFVAYDLAKQLKQEAVNSAAVAVVVFLLINIDAKTQSLITENLGSKGLFTAIVIASICVRAQKFFTDKNLVIKLPSNVPAVVYESFLSLVPLTFLVVVFWLIRHYANLDINHGVQTLFSPVVFALNTLPGILTYAFLVTMLWSIGINGDNTMDAIVAPIFLQYLAENVTAFSRHEPIPYITAYGFFTTFVNVGGTGATIALALIMINSREPGFRKIARLSLPTQIFQINEPIFFGFPIVLNPIFMIPYILNALILTAATYALMAAHLISKPVINIPWTTPPIVGHFLATNGDWRAALWGFASILLAMAIYYPFAKTAERQRLANEKIAAGNSQTTVHG